MLAILQLVALTQLSGEASFSGHGHIQLAKDSAKRRREYYTRAALAPDWVASDGQIHFTSANGVVSFPAQEAETVGVRFSRDYLHQIPLWLWDYVDLRQLLPIVMWYGYKTLNPDAEPRTQ